jgi:hypothetical protein
MTDIVEQLRRYAGSVCLSTPTELAAADEIERLGVEVIRLRAELAEIKEVEFPRRVKAVAAAWRGKCERLQAELDSIKAEPPPAKKHSRSCAHVIETL